MADGTDADDVAVLRQLDLPGHDGDVDGGAGHRRPHGYGVPAKLITPAPSASRATVSRLWSLARRVTCSPGSGPVSAQGRCRDATSSASSPPAGTSARPRTQPASCAWPKPPALTISPRRQRLPRQPRPPREHRSRLQTGCLVIRDTRHQSPRHARQAGRPRRLVRARPPGAFLPRTRHRNRDPRPAHRQTDRLPATSPKHRRSGTRERHRPGRPALPAGEHCRRRLAELPTQAASPILTASPGDLG